MAIRVSALVLLLAATAVAKAHPKWSIMLQTYFDAVKNCYAEAIVEYGDKPSLANKQVAGFNARKKALKRTLDGIDLPELEKVWRKWVVDMRDPWPSLRKKKRARYKK